MSFLHYHGRIVAYHILESGGGIFVLKIQYTITHIFSGTRSEQKETEGYGMVRNGTG